MDVNDGNPRFFSRRDLWRPAGLVFVSAVLLQAQAGVELLPLPPVAGVKWQHGRAVALAGPPGQPELSVWSRGGGRVRSIAVLGAIPGARRAEAADFALDAEGTVHAAVVAELPLGRSARLLCSFPEAGDPRCEDTGEVRCRLLAASAPGVVWCFGPGPAGMLLHRVSGPKQGPRFWLPADALPHGRTAGAQQPAGAFSRSWMSAPGPERIVLFLHEPATLFEVDLRTGETRAVSLGRTLPLRAAPSFAASGGRLAALLPLDPSPAAERLDAPYGLFVRAPDGWRRAAPHLAWLRGARLAGLDPDAAWVWSRGKQRLERVPLPP